LQGLYHTTDNDKFRALSAELVKNLVIVTKKQVESERIWASFVKQGAETSSRIRICGPSMVKPKRNILPLCHAGRLCAGIQTQSLLG
jgi:hypothetical protein